MYPYYRLGSKIAAGDIPPASRHSMDLPEARLPLLPLRR